MPDFEALIADWLVEYRSKSTREKYRCAVLQFETWLDGDLLEATRSDIRRWIAHLSSEGWADNTIGVKKTAVVQFFRHLYVESVIDENPAVEISFRKAEPAPRLGLDAAEAHKIIAAAENHSRYVAALVWLMAGAGLRVHEACSARIEDLEDDLLTVRVKGGHRQVKALSEEVLSAVSAVSDGREEGPIIVDGDGRPVKDWRAQDLIRDLGKHAGITEKVTPHILRHTAATLSLEAGTPVEDVKELLGHASVETTLRYVRNRDVIGGTRAAAARLGKTLRGSAP